MRADCVAVVGDGGASEVVLRHIFIRLMSDVERAGAKHDAHGANVVKMNEVAPAGQPAGLRERHAVCARNGDGVAHERIVDRVKEDVGRIRRERGLE